MTHTVFITGAAGYIGAMLVRRFAAREDVSQVIALDKEAQPDVLYDVPKLIYIQANLAEDAWEAKVKSYAPDIVIHAAWQIRPFYGNPEKSWQWNVEGSKRVFVFAGALGARLIHFSTIASYGPFPVNTRTQLFTEESVLRESGYQYADEKRAAEEELIKQFETLSTPGVCVVRPASITGPRGRFMRTSFGLQSALTGKLQGSFFNRIVSFLSARIPATPQFARQFVHEDDVVSAVELLATTPSEAGIQLFNLCPLGDVLDARDLAQIVGKRTLPIAPWMVRVAFFLFWHLSRGRIPTAPGSWKGYSYPIVVDGTKITRTKGYQYQYSGKDAFEFTDGAYEPFLPQAVRHSKP